MVLNISAIPGFRNSRITLVIYVLKIEIWWSCDEDEVTPTLTPPPLFHKHDHAQRQRPCQDVFLWCATMF